MYPRSRSIILINRALISKKIKNYVLEIINSDNECFRYKDRDEREHKQDFCAHLALNSFQQREGSEQRW